MDPPGAARASGTWYGSMGALPSAAPRSRRGPEGVKVVARRHHRQPGTISVVPAKDTSRGGGERSSIPDTDRSDGQLVVCPPIFTVNLVVAADADRPFQRRYGRLQARFVGLNDLSGLLARRAACPLRSTALVARRAFAASAQHRAA